MYTQGIINQQSFIKLMCVTPSTVWLLNATSHAWILHWPLLLESDTFASNHQNTERDCFAWCWKFVISIFNIFLCNCWQIFILYVCVCKGPHENAEGRCIRGVVGHQRRPYLAVAAASSKHQRRCDWEGNFLQVLHSAQMQCRNVSPKSCNLTPGLHAGL